MTNKKSKASASASRSTNHALLRGRNRRFEDSRNKRGAQKLRRELQGE